MRLKRVEYITIALTVAFICFMGGYYTGSRGSVNIMTVDPQHGEVQQISKTEPSNNGIHIQSPAETAIGNAEPTGQIENNSMTGEQPVSSRIPGAPRANDGKININTASKAELMDLPGIGSVLAGRIIDYRNQKGPFSSIEEILRVSGIGEKKFEAIKEKITVS